jgi:hypothetical protein
MSTERGGTPVARKSDGGCLGIAFAAVTLLTAVSAGAGLFSAPALIGYFLIADPEQVRSEAPVAAGTLVATVLLAVALVVVTGRDRPTVPRVLRRTVVLLLATTVTSVVSFLFELHGNFPPTLHISAAPLFAVAAVAIMVLGFWRIKDGRTTASPDRVGRRPNRGNGAARRRPKRVDPVTVEQVHQVTELAKQSLRRVRAENDRLERLLRDLEAKLAVAQAETSFAGLQHLHWESRSCADRVHEHYRSSDRILGQITRAHAGVQVVLGGAPVRGCSRPNRPAYAAAASEMATTERRLQSEVNRGRFMVSTLNQRTEALKYRIRDDCGARGECWYDDLMIRREAARAAEGRH